jgi:hypothetical protein
VKQGDTLPVLASVLFHPDLSIADLTDATVVLRLLHMETHGTVTLPAIIVDDPTQGTVEHIWQPGETDISGAYFYHWIAEWPDHYIETFPNDRRGRVLNIEALYPRYAAVPRRRHFLCGDTGGQARLVGDLEVFVLDVGRMRARMHGQGSTTVEGGLSRGRWGLIGQGRLELNAGQDLELHGAEVWLGGVRPTS